MPSLKLGSVHCEAGRKATGFVIAVNRVDGTDLGIPVIIVCGKKDGPVLLVDGGIHGDEQEGTFAISEFARELDPERLRGTFIGVPVLNTASFEAMERGNPRDHHSYDMNRIYPGRPNGYLTERIAHVHDTAIASIADLELAIHSGGNICYLGETIFFPTGDKSSFELARSMGPDWEIILDAPRAGGSPMAAMAERDKPAVTVELGGCCMTLPADFRHNIDVLKRSFSNTCRHYDMIEGEAEYAQGVWRGKQQVVQASKSGLLEPNPEIPIKKPIQKGDVLLRITDFFREPIEELKAPCDGTLFGFRTYPSVCAGDWSLFCAEATYESMESA